VHVGAEPEQDQVEPGLGVAELLAQRLLVSLPSLERAALPLHPPHLRRVGADTEPAQQRPAHHPEVRVLVVGRDAALVAEPECRVGPVGVELGGLFVRAPRRGASSKRDVAACVGRSGEPLCGLGRGIVEDDHVPPPHRTIFPAAASAGL
jgi:hypothetical protein